MNALQEPTRHALLVAGMHRSGTSALSGALSQLGAQAPATSMPTTEDNARGYFESVDIMDFDERVLVSADRAWDDWRPWPESWIASPAAAVFREELVDLLRREYGASSLPLVKDPRFCRFLPLWTECLSTQGYTPVVLLCVRHPIEVARSLARRDGMPREQALLLWLRHMLEAERDTRLVPRRAVSYARLLANPKLELQAIADQFGISWPRRIDDAAAEINGFLSSTLRHERASDQDGEGVRDGASEWALRAYRALQMLAGATDADEAVASTVVVGMEEAVGTAERAQAELDAIWREFEQAYRRLGPAVHLVFAEARRAGASAARVPTLEEQVARQAREIAALTRRTAAAEGHPLSGSNGATDDGTPSYRQGEANK